MPLHPAVPVLMYHAVADPPPGSPYPGLFVRPTDLAGQIGWLRAHGYQAVTLRSVWRHWRSGSPLPARPVVVTFDDGYRSVVANAFPLLRAHHWPGVLDLELHNLHVSWGISPREVEELIAERWEIAAHSLTHSSLPGLDEDALEREVLGSRREILARFGVAPLFFGYPAGAYDERVLAAVRRAGFVGALTTENGLARPTEPYALDRVRIGRSDGVAGLVTKLRTLEAQESRPG